MVSGSLSCDKTNDASTTEALGTPSVVAGRIWTVSGRVSGQNGTPPMIEMQLLTNAPISVMVVGCERVNFGPTNCVGRMLVPLDPDVLNCVDGVAAVNESSIEMVAVFPGTTVAKINRPATSIAMNCRSFLVWA